MREINWLLQCIKGPVMIKLILYIIYSANALFCFVWTLLNFRVPEDKIELISIPIFLVANFLFKYKKFFLPDVHKFIGEEVQGIFPLFCSIYTIKHIGKYYSYADVGIIAVLVLVIGLASLDHYLSKKSAAQTLTPNEG